MSAKVLQLLFLCGAGACAASPTSSVASSAEPWRALPSTLPLVAHEPRVADYDVEHYALALELEPATRSIRGTCAVRLWPRVAGLARVDLDLVGLEVSAVRDGEGRALDFRQDADSVEVGLARPLALDEFAEVSIDYAGAPLRGLYFVADRGAGPTQAFTQGECEDARYWFPCWDFPNDRATSEIRVTLPPGWVSIAAGERVDRVDLDGGRTLEHWSMTTPHPTYLTTLCAGDFAVTESRWENVPLYFAVPPELAPLAERSFEETDEILTFLSDVTSFRYPYAKYAQTCVEDFRFGGMENVSATTLTDDALKDELGLRDGTMTGLVAHEAAHQWFGDLLTCADWSHIWLNEGFATYMELLYVEATQGEDAFHARLRGALESYLGADVGPQRRPTVWNVYREPMDLFFDGQAYAGGALRLHHLRFVLGDELFFAGLREYVWSNAGRSVVTEDLQRAMERASGRDLEGFFQQWFHSRGYPEFAVSWEWDEGAREIVLDVEQVQATADGTPSAFRAPVEVLYDEDTGVASARLEVSHRHGEFRIPASTRPKWVEFDPRLRMPRRAQANRSLDESVAMVLCDDASIRAVAIESFETIARDTGRPIHERATSLMALAKSLENRASIARAPDAVSTLALAAEREFDRPPHQIVMGLNGHPDPDGPTFREYVRAVLLWRTRGNDNAATSAAAWRSLAAFLPSAEVLEAARREVLETPFSWQTRIQAARLVALAEREHAREWLQRCMGIASPQGEFQVGLLGILGELEGEKAIPVFRRWLDDESAPTQVRQAAARSIGAHGRAFDGAREMLERHLDPSRFQLSGAVLDALFQLRDAASIPAVRRYLEHPLDSRQRRAGERILAANWAGA